VSYTSTAVAACALMAGVGAMVTQPEELRPFRWLKVFLSFPLVLLFVSAFYDSTVTSGIFSIFGFAILAFIWKTPMAYFGGFCVSHLIFGGNWKTGIHADIAGAKALARHGDLDAAIQYLEAELEKEPANYEGVLLLSDGYAQKHQLARSCGLLQKLCNSETLTPEQKIMVEQRKTDLENRMLIEQIKSSK